MRKGSERLLTPAFVNSLNNFGLKIFSNAPGRFTKAYYPFKVKKDENK